MIYELLKAGKEEAITGKELSTILGVDIRVITEQVRRERLAHRPICATSSYPVMGFYVAKDREELREFCDRLSHRENELAEVIESLRACEDELPERDTDAK